MRTWTLLLLATACGGAEPDDTSPQGPEPGCLSAPARISLVNNESSKPVTQRVSVSNTCGAEVTAALALEGGDGVAFEDDATSATFPDGESSTVTLTYLPDAPGSSEGVLRITPSDTEIDAIEVDFTADAPGARWDISLLVQDPLVRECPGEFQLRFKNIGEGKGVRPKASITATNAEVRLVRSVLPEEGAANLDVSPALMHAVTAELEVTVEDAFIGPSTESFTLEADPLPEREELFVAGTTGPVTLAEAPWPASIEVEVNEVIVPGWILSGQELTLPETVDRLTDDVIVRYVVASACPE